MERTTSWYLKRINSTNQNSIYPLAKNNIIGKSKHSTIRIYGPNIKRIHCVIQINENGINILDLSSKGIFINENRCGIFQPLYHNDIIRMTPPRYP